jgi:DNA polymerase III epsilon subunit-like protein
MVEYYLAVDTETTGLSEKCNVLTSYFVILDKDLVEIDTLDLYIKHDEYYIQRKAMEINKINLKEHEKIADTVETSKQKIEDFIRSNCDSEKEITFIPFGHNVSYDLKMIRSNNLFTNYVENKLTKEYLDTIDVGKELKKEKLIPYKQSLSLGKICSFLDIKSESTLLHNAEYDIRLTIDLFKKFKDMKSP